MSDARRERELEKTRAIWHNYLTGEGQSDEGVKKALRVLFEHLPSDPRCKLCRAPFRGPGSVVARSLGFSVNAWQMNPTLCNRCETYVRKHGVGAEVELTLVFADVRGSTELAEQLGPEVYRDLIDRFYRSASEVLLRHDALLENLIGDEVAALFVPGIAGPNYPARAVEAARELLRATGHGTDQGPWIRVGAGVHTGRAYVGAVGSDQSVSTLTVLGDVANVAARLASAAGTGEVLVSDATIRRGELGLSHLEDRSLVLKGVGMPVDVKVIQAGVGSA